MIWKGTEGLIIFRHWLWHWGEPNIDHVTMFGVLLYFPYFTTYTCANCRNIHWIVYQYTFWYNVGCLWAGVYVLYSLHVPSLTFHVHTLPRTYACVNVICLLALPIISTLSHNNRELIFLVFHGTIKKDCLMHVSVWCSYYLRSWFYLHEHTTPR